MTLTYEGWCRRIDLNFRTKYPFLKTKIYKINNHKYNILVVDQVENFSDISNNFDTSIRYVTAPIHLVDKAPCEYEREIKGISDDEIPSNFEGFPFTLFQISNLIACTHSELDVSGVKEDHENRKIMVELAGEPAHEKKRCLQETLDKLKMPYSFEIADGGVDGIIKAPSDEVFNIASAKSKKKLSCPFLERDEELWFENVDSIYNGSVTKKDLYFYDPHKTCCLVNFSRFNNANLRNHLLLYDVVYCILPLAEGMNSFLNEQKITRDEILHLIERGRLKILNIQPESRLDNGFINEAFQTNQSSVVSRRALSALCAMDLVSINKSYVFSDPELDSLIFPLVSELSKAVNKPMEIVSSFLLWPKYALRSSLDTLNGAGPMGISRYGVNRPIIEGMSFPDKDKIEFEFIVNSDQIHLAHALDATYFPFFVEDGKYTDHPYALMMGNMLNFYKTYNYKCMSEFSDLELSKTNGNPSIQLISTFDINDYISIREFEKEISSSIIRQGMNSLFSELAALDEQARGARISEYNIEVEKALNRQGVVSHALDLAEDAAGLVFTLPGATGKKLLKTSVEKAREKFLVIQEVLEFIEDKRLPKDDAKRNISLLTQVNRVARLKKKYE